MSPVMCQQLYELWKKDGLIKSKKTPESSRALEAIVAALETKTGSRSNENLFADEEPPLTEWEMAPDRVVQTHDSYDHQ